MAERVETIRLTAQVANYITGMQAAQRATQQTATAAQKLANQGQAFTTLGRTLVVAGAAIAAGVVLAVKTFADFDAQMSQVKTLSGATAEEMGRLADAAETLGQKIGISASQAADAEIELVKAGVSVSDILGGALQGSLQLAAAGQIDVADATEIATIALTQFGLKGQDIPHVADLLTAGADKALGGVGDLGEALKSGGLVASQFGISLEETIGTLSAFANAGLIGETAGTDLRQMLLKLADPSAEAAQRLKDLGVSLYDTNGEFVGLANLSGQLQKALGDQTESYRNASLSIIFGSRAIAGANVLYKEGAAGIKKWTDEVDDSGFAARQAAGKMDNLNGDISKLGAAFQTDLIRSGSAANDVLRELVQMLTGLVAAFGNLPTGVQGSVLAIGAIVAVLALVTGSVLTAIPKIVELREAMATLDISAKGVASSVGLIGGAIGVALLVVGAFAAQQAQTKAKTDDFAGSLDEATGAITSYSRALVAKSLQESKLFGPAEKAGVTQKQLTDAVIEGGAAYDRVRDKIHQYAVENHYLLTEQDANGRQLDIYTKQLDAQRGVVVQGTKDKKDLIAATEEDAATTQTAAESYQSAATKAQNLNDQISQLVDTINTANGVGQDAVAKNAAYQKALADVTDFADKAKKKVDGYTLGVDENTASGSANVAMLADLAKKNEDAAKAQFDLDGNTDSYVATLTAGHQAVVDHALALGATADQAQAIADKVAAIPTDKQVQILVDTTQANDSLDVLEKRFGSLNAAAVLQGARLAGLAQKYGNMPKGSWATGGFTGNGPKYAVAGVVHRGEFVSTAEVTAKPANRAALEYMHAGGTIGYANGGYVGAPSMAAAGGSMAIYVQNPFTGEYLLAQVADVAGGVVGAASFARRTGMATGKQRTAY